MKSVNCIGLFGTCGASTWRNEFINKYNELGINYFNPQVENWTPECADIEAAHLKRDDIILFPVTGETYGTGSLAETGFSIIQAVQSNSNRWVIVMIEPDIDEILKANEIAYKESVRARKLVSSHLAENPHPSVFIVKSLDQMLSLSIELYDIGSSLRNLRNRYANQK